MVFPVITYARLILEVMLGPALTNPTVRHALKFYLTTVLDNARFKVSWHASEHRAPSHREHYLRTQETLDIDISIVSDEVETQNSVVLFKSICHNFHVVKPNIVVRHVHMD